MPGTLRGADPVATMISFASSVCFSPSTTSTLPPPASRAVPLIQVILFFLNRNSTPLVRPVTILSLRACTWSCRSPASPSGMMTPHSFAFWTTFKRVGVLEQRLGRNAAPDQTGAAERFLLFDDRDGLAELCARMAAT